MELSRSREGKPFLVAAPLESPRFNFNISHHGDWVAIVAHDGAAVGCDVSKVERPRGARSIADFFVTMEGCFTPREWVAIKGEGGSGDAAWEAGALERFYRNWTLKESLTKAMGIGLGFDLQRIEFRRVDRCDANQYGVWIDDVHRSEWAFVCSFLDAAHPVTVARGPWQSSVAAHCAAIVATPPPPPPPAATGSSSDDRKSFDSASFGTRFQVLTSRDLVASMSLRDRVAAGLC